MQFVRLRKRSVGIRRKLLLEGLSPRALLAGVTTELFDGIATVSGSLAGDEIVIAPMAQRDEVHVFAGGQCISAWRRSDVREIDVQSFEGDDLIRVADSVTIPVKVTGGGGLDTILIDHPHDHRHGWLFDVEQVMAEGEFTSSSAVGQTDHANHTGHTTSSASPAIQLSPILTDHLHVEPQLAASQVETPAGHGHDATAETTVMPVHDTTAESSVMAEHGMTAVASETNSATTGLREETNLSDSANSSTQHASHVGHEAGIAAVGTASATASTLAVTSPGASIDHGEHAGHGASAASTGDLATAHSGHDNGVAAGAHEHGGNTTSAVQSDHAGHSQGMSTFEPGRATTYEAGHQGHAGGESTSLHDATRHDGAGGWDTSPGALATIRPDAHSGHRCEGEHGTTASGNGGDQALQHQGTGRLPAHSFSSSTIVPDCHSPTGLSKTDASVQEPDAAAPDRKEGAGQVTAKEPQAEDRPTTIRSHLALLLAAAGTLLFICAVRPWRSSTLPNDSDEQTSRFAFEWLGGRGAPNV